MSELTRVFPEKTLRKIENAEASQQFDELLACAVETCLNSPPEFESRQPSDEAKVVSELGVRGLRAAIDLSLGSAVHMYRDNGIEMDTPIRAPERFGDATSPEIMAKVKRFGEALLDEAYLCLGEGVEEQVAQFAIAPSDEEQIKAIEWMLERLKDMTEQDAVPEGQTPHYHPARLSPKLIGAYPNNELTPTCLSISMIAASFLHRAGADILHAGVMNTYREHAAAEAAYFLSLLSGFAQSMYRVNLPPDLQKSLADKALSLMEQIHNDNGYHAAVVARLKSGDWVQVDPNFNASTVITGHGRIALDLALENLDDLHEIAPGLETTVFAPLGTVSDLARMMITTGNESLLGDPQKIREALITAPSLGILCEQVKEEFVDPFFVAERDEEGLNESWFTFSGMKKPGEDYTPDGLFTNLFNKYVLHDESSEEFFKRCHCDEAYLHERIEDIRALPLMMIAGYVLQTLREPASTPNHVTLEVGLPAARIGSAVLNDFASYCDDRLSPSFRLSHWSSHVPITEVMQVSNLSERQTRLIENNAQWLRTGLRYNKDHGIVTPFLVNQEQRRSHEDGAHA